VRENPLSLRKMVDGMVKEKIQKKRRRGNIFFAAPSTTKKPRNHKIHLRKKISKKYSRVLNVKSKNTHFPDRYSAKNG